MAAPPQSEVQPSPPPLRVRYEGRVLRLSQSFHVGRDADCDVRLDDVQVSRRHVLVSFDKGIWSFQDLRSGNGVYVDGQRVQSGTIDPTLTMSLGLNGPLLTFDVERPGHLTDPHKTARETVANPRETMLLDNYAERYFTPASDDEPVGRQTMLIRKAFAKVHKRQRRRYTWAMAALALAVVGATGYALYQRRQIDQQRALAEDLFYSMKSLDVDIAKLELAVAQSGNTLVQDQVSQYLVRRRQMESTYDSFVRTLYSRNLTEPERLILRVTRLLGECELAAPPEYLDEVGRYIAKWQSSGRFARSLTLAQEKGYVPRIVQEFLQQNLPPQFLYLAMQESDFDAFTSGPPTYMGIAKGMWQFVPETAQRYGLKIGPLAGVRQPDAGDDRHNWDKATVAAARYIKDIYSTDAQASALLVMASYNWGENRVINLVRSLSANPKDRNFWKLLDRYRDRIPKQTYDYVFYIVSAAVIGENPKMFGFPFDGPLKYLENPQTAAR